ncbi:hypothetical protein [Ktedonobacter sp. SOSP1-52]|uniref:hypothetical protein n=1 Tax=Ktedonobacter sp. SOSP1-52 TaxID=2778366 RepID=UPI001F41DBC3|nr:hypothetical protein [Ktedonobacter sp. SOSP1-52]
MLIKQQFGVRYHPAHWEASELRAPSGLRALLVVHWQLLRTPQRSDHELSILSLIENQAT